MSYLVDGQPFLPINLQENFQWSQICTSHPEIDDPNCPNVGIFGEFNPTQFSNGTHTFTITVGDGAGNVTSRNTTFSVQNVVDTTAPQMRVPTVNANQATVYILFVGSRRIRCGVRVLFSGWPTVLTN